MGLCVLPESVTFGPVNFPGQNQILHMQKIFVALLILSLFVSCKKEKTNPAMATTGKIVVTNSAGQPEGGATVSLFHSTQDLISGTGAYATLQTDASGTVPLPANSPDTLICLAVKNGLSSEFIAFKYPVTQHVCNVQMAQPTGTQLLCGHGTKKWLMTSYSINGTPQSYVVTSTLYADGTWTDTNGNSGAWHFENNGTELVYDYTSSGMVVNFTILEFNATFIKLEAEQMGTLINMEMTAVQ